MVHQLKDLRGEGSAADGLVWVQVDGSGQLTDLVFDTEAPHLLSTAELAAAVKAAILQAHAAVQPQLAQLVAGTAPALPGHDQLADALSQASLVAERGLNEMTTMVYDLVRQVSRR
jgi:DNA-binding protein YbaB